MEVTNSKTAVDILPFWTNKMKALNEVLTWRYMIYFWDSENDLPAFKEANFWVIPGNATKKFVKKVVKSKNLTFVALWKEIDWVLDWLKYLNKILGYEWEDSE